MDGLNLLPISPAALKFCNKNAMFPSGRLQINVYHHC